MVALVGIEQQKDAAETCGLKTSVVVMVETGHQGGSDLVAPKTKETGWSH